MAAFARTELDLRRRWPARTTRRRSSCSSSATARCSGRDVFLLDAPRDVADDEVLGRLPAPVLRPGHQRPARGARARAPLTDAADLEALPGRPAGERPVRLRTPQRGEKRELMELAARNAAETLAREQARWLADQGKTLGALEELAGGAGPAGPAAADRVLRHLATSRARQSVGSMVVFEEGRPRTGEYRRFQIRTVAGPERLRQPPGGPAPPLPRRQGGRGGDRGGAPLGDAGPRHHRRRPGPGERGQGGPRRAGPGRSAAGRAGQGARGADPARTARSRSCCRPPRRPSTSSSACATRPTASPSPTTAPCATGRRSRSAFDDLPGVGPKRKRRAAQGLRVGEAGARGAGRADRGGAGDRAGAGGADQGPPRGLMPLAPAGTGATIGLIAEPM